MSAMLALALSAPAMAFEGHWRPDQLVELKSELDALGVKVPPEKLADLDGEVLGSVLDMDFCSAAFVSADGLVATAYHCVTEMLQYASHGDEDLFQTGFYAPTRADERWGGPEARVRLTVATEDVTDTVLAGTKKLEGSKRLERIESNMRAIVARCEASGEHRCRVATYDAGGAYELLRQIELSDMRLVFAPPNDVGYFGGDQDNWRWPRHSGDFAFIRAYVSPDGRPADHHPANVPYQPERHLKVAPRGPKAGEPVLVAGYPSGTYRWRSAAELDFAEEESWPLQIELSRDLLAIFERHADKDPALAAMLAPRRLNTSNDLIYLEGTVEQLERSGVADDKWQLERDLARWIASDDTRTTEWGRVLDTIHRLEAEEAATAERDRVIREMVDEVALLDAAVTIYKLAVESALPDKDRDTGFQNRDRPDIAHRLDQRDAAWDWRVDRDVLVYFLMRAHALPKGLHVPELDVWLALDPADDARAQITAKVDALYAHLELADSDERTALMGTSAWYLTTSGGPWFQLAAALQPFLDKIEEEHDTREAEWREVKPLYLAAMQAYIPEGRPRYIASTRRFAPGVYYPDANRTLRVTIGKVDGYFPRDGLIAAPRTSLAGIAAKADLSGYPVPADLAAALDDADHGPYADADLRSVPVDFLSTVDTARGSSGSATLNGKGEFVGILFDGNYEAIASDWIFEEDVTRSIHTDVDYMLWYLDRVAGAGPLVKELGREPHFTGGGIGSAE